jgi:hypothetical protein
MLEEIKFTYNFVKRGSKAKGIAAENIWIDVGNKVDMGVFDHHQEGGLSSSFECIKKNYDKYLTSARDYLKAQEKTTKQITIIVHEEPDLDCIASAYAVKKILEKDYGGEWVDDIAWGELTEYVNDIDNGIKKIMSEATLYAYVCTIGRDESDPENRNREIMKEGLLLFDLVCKKIADKSIKKDDLYNKPLEEYIEIENLKYLDAVKEQIKCSRDGYRRDKEENRVVVKNIGLWKENQLEPVKAAIWYKNPSEEDEYIFARDDDECMITVYPFENKNTGEIDRTIIALNPNMEGYENYTLLPVAEIIEQCEQIAEKELYREKGRFIRDHSHPRETEGVFSELPFSATSDPWFISEEKGIIDAPGNRSILEYKQIVSIVENTGFMAKKFELVKLVEDGSKSLSLIDKANIRFGEIYKESSKYLSEGETTEEDEYFFAMVKVDASILQRSNALLKMICLNVAGKSDSLFCEDNFLVIDYRTCLYVDGTITILAACDDGNKSLQHILKAKDDKEEDKDGYKCSGSRLYTNLFKLFSHRCQLQKIGKSLAEKADLKNDNMDTRTMNSELVALISEMQTDDIIVNPVEQEVYSFIKEKLQIENLKDSVMNVSELVIRNAEEQEEMIEQKQSKKIEFIMTFISILAIFSAWTDGYDFFEHFSANDSGKINLRTFWMGANHLQQIVVIVVFAIFIWSLWLLGGMIKSWVQGWERNHKKYKKR